MKWIVAAVFFALTSSPMPNRTSGFVDGYSISEPGAVGVCKASTTCPPTGNDRTVAGLEISCRVMSTPDAPCCTMGAA